MPTTAPDPPAPPARPCPLSAAGQGGALDPMWAEISDDLGSWLRSRGVTPCEADDTVQEVAARVLVSSVEFVSAAHLFAWSRTTATRILVDNARRDALIDLTAEVPEGCDVDDTSFLDGEDAAVALARLLRWLTAEERLLLVGPAPAGPERASFYVRRHRLRVRLRARLEREGF